MQLLLNAAESGYRWLGLDTAAQVVAVVRSEIGGGALDDDERADSLELRGDEDYAQAIPRDQVLVDAFQTKFSNDPQAFASTSAAARSPTTSALRTSRAPSAA
jgi:hypothetical protein